MGSQESAALADRLIQGQVTRAQEAEENDVIRRELALTRQRCSSATQSLQRAQSTIRQLQDQQGNPRFSEEFVTHLELELEQSRLRESETLGALKDLQDKVLDMEKSPGQQEVGRLQEELRAVALREAQALRALEELQHRVQELSDTWQGGSRGSLQEALMGARLREAQAQGELRALRQRVLSLETQSKEEVVAVRLRQADTMAALAEMRQRVAELELQREEGRIQGELNHSDAAECIRELREHLGELKAEIRLLRGPLAFGGGGLGPPLGDEDSLGSSEEELGPFPLPLPHGHLGDTSDSDTEGAPTAP